MSETIASGGYNMPSRPAPSIQQQELWLRQSLAQAELDRQAWMMREQKEKERRDREFQWQMWKANEDAQKSAFRRDAIEKMGRMREEYGLKEQDRARRLREERMQQGWQLPDHLRDLDGQLNQTEATALEMFQRGKLDRDMLNQVLAKVDDGRIRLIPTVRPQGQMGLGGGQFMTDPNGNGTVFQYNDGNQIRAMQVHGQGQGASHDHQLAMEAMKMAADQTVVETDTATGRKIQRQLTPQEQEAAAGRIFKQLKGMTGGSMGGGMQGAGMQGGGMPGSMPSAMRGGAMQGAMQGGMPGASPGVSVDDGIGIMGRISPNWANALSQYRDEPEAAAMSQILARNGRVPNEASPDYQAFVNAMNALKSKVAMSQLGSGLARSSQFETDPSAPPLPEDSVSANPAPSRAEMMRRQTVPQTMQQSVPQSRPQMGSVPQPQPQAAVSQEKREVQLTPEEFAAAIGVVRRTSPEIATAIQETAGDPAAKEAGKLMLLMIARNNGMPPPGTPEGNEFNRAAYELKMARDRIRKSRPGEMPDAVGVPKADRYMPKY